MKVDIIIPSYHGTYLFDTIKSCVNQTYKDFKITVVDNNSPNNIEAICKRFPNINYIRSPENNGPAGARNFGLQHTSAPFVSFIDDDDIMHQNKLLYSINEFKKDSSIGMTCGNYQIMVNGRIRKPFYKSKIKVNYDALMRVNYVASGSVTLKREAINKVGLFNEDYWIAEDFDYWLRLSEEFPIKYIHKVLYYYRIIPKGNSLTQRADIQEKHISNIKKIKRDSLKRMNEKNISGQ